tara:strand:- start:993 stop:1535 length:543 start_codon:yes stop_codon:yes gene_type:complete
VREISNSIKIPEKKDVIKDTNKSEVNTNNFSVNNSIDSEIYNLSYKKFDIHNNVYLIEARKGTIKSENPEIIFMNNVTSSITYKNNEKLLISSKNAIFNKVDFETRFLDEVILLYKDHRLKSDTLEFLFNKNIAIFRDNVIYRNIDTKMFSDKIIIDLITKEIEITSKNNSEKIIIEKNN